MTEHTADLRREEPPLPSACTDVTCEWASVPHVHEGREVYPLPPDRPEWTPHYLAGFETEATE